MDWILYLLLALAAAGDILLAVVLAKVMRKNAGPEQKIDTADDFVRAVTPVLALQDGAIKLVDKGRGRPGALVAMFKQLDTLGGVDPRYGDTLLSRDNKQLVAPVHHYMHQNLQLTGGRVAQLGPTIGTHVGPGVVGVVFVAKE